MTTATMPADQADGQRNPARHKRALEKVAAVVVGAEQKIVLLHLVATMVISMPSAERFSI